MLDNYDKRLKVQVLTELTSRARCGILIYPILWFSIALWAELHTLQAPFFYLNSFIILLLFGVRAANYFCMKALADKNVKTLSQWLIIGVLANALHWGLLTAWIVTHPSLDKIHYIIIIATTASTMAASSNLSISKEIRYFHPYFSILPGVLSVYLLNIEKDLFIAFLSIFSLIYIVKTAGKVGTDYWNSVHNNLIANDRALQLEKLNNTDSLTQLYNRPYFDRCLLKEWQSGVQQIKPITLMMIDLDHFKSINDNFGHQFGDTCLVAFSQLLTQVINKKTDVVARYGGEEFIVLLPKTDLNNAKKLADNILNSVANLSIEHEQQKITLSCSIGIHSLIPSSEINSSDLIKKADNALYVAKNSGRKRYHVYDLKI